MVKRKKKVDAAFLQETNFIQSLKTNIFFWGWNICACIFKFSVY